MKNSAITRRQVNDRNGHQLAPMQPSLRLPEISERARLRAKAFSLVRSDRIAIAVHTRMLAWLDSKDPLHV